EFVDPRRHDKKRPAPDLRRGRRILNELHHLVLKDDLARCGGDVFADAKGVWRRHGDGEAALAAFEVADQIGKTVQEIVAAAFDRRFQVLGVGRDEIRWRDRIDELPRIELGLAGLSWIESLDLA